MIPRLGVNIDHVATLRQQREEGYPSVVDAANICLKSGADQITIHLREDRRHIQDTDVEAVSLVTKKYGKPLNFEIGCDPEIIEIAIVTAPDWVCLVPEKREEKTTEGGLNLMDSANYTRVSEACDRIKEKSPNTKVSLFLEANEDILAKAASMNIDAVEIHTGDFARAHLVGENYQSFLDDFAQAKNFLEKNKIGCHAGHGLTDESVKPLIERDLFVEYNIGHWIVSQAVFDGLSSVISSLKKTMEGNLL